MYSTAEPKFHVIAKPTFCAYIHGISTKRFDMSSTLYHG